MRRAFLTILPLLAGFTLLSPVASGCSSSSAASTPTDAGPEASPLAPLPPECDPLVPSHCGFPMPSNVWTRADPSSKTGLRVDLKQAVLPLHGGQPSKPDPWNKLDGFSTGMNLVVHLPGATVAGLPSHLDLARSVQKDSKTLVMDAETGEFVPHWSELDATVKALEEPDQKAFLVRPAVRLKDARRYIVAIRHVVDARGAELPASPAFRALRDGGAAEHPSIEARRSLYADIFGKLEKAGVPRGELQLAWDFTTSSRENNTGAMLAMRDQALTLVGEDGPEYTITSEVDNPNPDTRKKYIVSMKVPLYLDRAEKGGKLVQDAEGRPRQNGFAEFPVVIHIPNSAVAEGAPRAALLQNGHGLLGRKFEGDGGYLTMIGNKQNYVTFSVDFVGMAEADVGTVSETIVGDMGGFKDVVGRQHQGVLNSLLAMRMMKGRFARDQEKIWGRSIIDPGLCFYRGDSQGGIFGGTYMALSTDVTRGLLSVPGAPYSLLLSRSSDFRPFYLLLGTVYTTTLDVQIVLGLAQMLWDKTEPNGYIPYITEDTLPGTPSHNILIHNALGDHQVNRLGAHYLARTTRAKLVDPFVGPVYGLTAAKAPVAGNAIVEWDFGNPPDPVENIAPSSGEDPHGLVRKIPEAYTQADTFFRTGQIVQTCKGPCVFSR